MRLARGGVTTLAVLLVVAVVAVVIAVGQRNNAVNQARIATVRQLAALAMSDLGNHVDLAQLAVSRLAADTRRHHDHAWRLIAGSTTC